MYMENGASPYNLFNLLTLRQLASYYFRYYSPVAKNEKQENDTLYHDLPNFTDSCLLC